MMKIVFLACLFGNLNFCGEKNEERRDETLWLKQKFFSKNIVYVSFTYLLKVSQAVQSLNFFKAFDYRQLFRADPKHF